jgi:hypothetical protein
LATSNLANTKIIFSETRAHPYYDDYDESKNFHKILFRPGYAVQARELTQLQTILQAQIERFGDHIFENGSLVLGGQISIGNAKYINLAPTFANTDVVASDFDQKTIQYTANTKARALVLGTEESTNTDPPVLVVTYLSGREFKNGNTLKVSGEEIYANVSSTDNVSGTALIATIDEGIFFVNGYFVKSGRQVIIADKYTPNANVKLGLEFTPSILDEDSDISLLDPAQESSNYQAPGAARFVIDMVFSSRALDSEDDEQFIELMRIENGVIKKQVKYPIYSEIGKTLARRTYDESGSYTVKPFKIAFQEHPTDDTKIRAILSSGKAYIQGFEQETISSSYVDLNRARTTSNVQNYDLYATYGNYFVGANLQGVFDHTAFALADIHCIPYQFISRGSSAAYNSTKIGTTRVRAIEYYSSSNTSNPNVATYKLSITGTQFSKIQTNANIAAALTTNSVALFSSNNLLSANNNAYNGATLRITVGGTTAQYTILSWNGSTKVATVTKDFIATPTSSSNAVIGFDFSDAESLTIDANTPGPPSERSNVNIAIASKLQQNTDQDAFLSETNLDSLVFKFPQDYLQYGGMSDQDFMYRKKFSVTFSSNQTTISVDAATEAFTGNASGVGTSTLLQHYIVIGSDNRVVRLESVTVDGSQTATLTATDYNGSATVFASVNLNSGNNVNPKKKLKISGNTTHFTSAASNGQFSLTKSNGVASNTSVYLNAGQVLIQFPSRTPNEWMSLYISDVRRIVAIYNLGTSAPGTSVSGKTDVRNLFNIDLGQRDSYYDHARISLKPNVGNGVIGPLLVVLDYYDHVSGLTNDGLGYFSIDSYPNANTTVGYADIPTFTQSDGLIVELRDCIDFRPRRQNASNTSPAYTFQGIRIPKINESFEADYSYYLARQDFIVITPDQSNPFQVLEGLPSLYPQYPRTIDESMVLYKIFLPPYTKSQEDITATFVENKRYTMRDIGILEKRIENLEYYQTLNTLEKSSSDLLILDEFGLERTKYGILADSFIGHGIGDVLNQDYKCGINKLFGALTPAWRRKELPLFNAANSSVKVVTNKTLLSYTEVDFVSQPWATQTENVQPFALVDFIGVLTLDPDSAVWIDTVTAPDVIINIGGVNDDYKAKVNSLPSITTSNFNANTSSSTEENDAFENTTTVENGWFGTNARRNPTVNEITSAFNNTNKTPSRVLYPVDPQAARWAAHDGR